MNIDIIMIGTYKIITILLTFFIECNTFTLSCNDYLSNINKVDRTRNSVRMPLLSTTFDNAFIKTITNNVKDIKTTSINDRLVLQYNDGTKDIFYDKENGVKKLIELARLMKNITIYTISDINFFDSIYSPYYCSRDI